MRKQLPFFEIAMLVFPACWTVASIYLSFRNQDWEWFSRAGAILCFAGAALPISRLLRLSSEDYAKENPGTFGFVIDSDWPPRKAVLGAKISRIAFILGGAGTLIWAYGDWIGAVFHPFPK